MQPAVRHVQLDHVAIADQINLSGANGTVVLNNGGNTLNLVGNIIGTPSSPGTYQFTLQVTDQVGAAIRGKFPQ